MALTEHWCCTTGAPAFDVALSEERDKLAKELKNAGHWLDIRTAAKCKEKTMKIYYWENSVGMSPDHGRVEAETDSEALQKMPKTAICLYRESDTPDGTPFVLVFSNPKPEVRKD